MKQQKRIAANSLSCCTTTKKMTTFLFCLSFSWVGFGLSVSSVLHAHTKSRKSIKDRQPKINLTDNSRTDRFQDCLLPPLVEFNNWIG